MPLTTTAPGPSMAPPLGLHAVDGLEVAHRVEVPEHACRRAPSSARRWPSIDPENTTPGIAVTAADCAGLQLAARRAARRRLARDQTLLPSAMRSARQSAAGCDRVERAVERSPCACGRRRTSAAKTLLAVARHAPLHAAVDAALADARLPDDLAVLVRIERPDDAGLLSGEQQLAAAGASREDRRRAEVVVRARSPSGQLGACRRSHAGRVVDVVRQRPASTRRCAPRVEIERDDRVAQSAWRAASSCCRS